MMETNSPSETERPEIVFDEASHSYAVNGKIVPSVTTIIKATVPIAFSAGAWYGYKMGTRAAYEVAQMVDAIAIDHEQFYGLAKNVENPNTVLKSAGDRGTAIHDVMEGWAKDGSVPNPLQFDEEVRPRIQGVARWIGDNKPHFFGQEIVTASVEYGYAGTLDAYVRFDAGKYEGKTARIDYKTSKAVYPEQHFPQIAAYEAAEIECGAEPSDLQLVIHIPEDGKVKMVESTDTFLDFECLLVQWMSQEIRKRKLKDRKANGS